MSGVHRAAEVSQAGVQRIAVDSSSSGESMGTVATQYRVTVEQGRTQEELEENVAKLEAELEAAVANPAVQVDKR